MVEALPSSEVFALEIDFFLLTSFITKNKKNGPFALYFKPVLVRFKLSHRKSLKTAKKQGEQPMSHFVGLDVSDNTISICIVNEKGAIVHEIVCPTDPKLIDLELKKTELPIASIGLETGPMANWLTRTLRKLGWNVRCIDSYKSSKLISVNINKTDKNDARIIAEIIRINCFSSIVKMDVHVKSSEAQNLKRSIDVRQTLVQTRTRLYHAIKGFLKGEGIKSPSVSPEEFCKKVRDSTKDLVPLLISSMHSLLETYATLSKEIDQMTLRLETIAVKNEDAKLLMEMTGVGAITALCFIAVIDDPKRFKNSKAVGPYVGLTPTQYSSGQSERQGSISKKGDKTLRTLLYECAVVLLFRSKKKSTLKTWGLKKAKTIGSRKAIVAVARKLAIRMHHVLLTKQPYVEIKPKPKLKPEHTLTTAQLELLLKQSQEKGFIQVAGIKQIKDLLEKSTSSSFKHIEKTYAKTSV